MRKKILLVLALALMIGSASASGNAGAITPDSFLWRGELTLETLHEMIVFNADQRAELQLIHAEERIAEMQVSSNPDAALGEYTKIMSRINSMENMGYQTTQMVQASIENHTRTLSQFGENQSVNDAMQMAKMTQSSIQQKQSAKINENQMVWNQIKTQYSIGYNEKSISELTGRSYGEVEKYIPAGVTQLYITKDDGTAIDEYFVTKTDADITIKKGISTIADQEYVLTLEDIRNYHSYYEKVQL
jgi:hypothetical protein